MKFKSVIGAFIFVLIACSIALVIFVQTKSFGRVLTRVITDISEKKFDTELKVRNISFNLFPPGIELNDVDLFKKISETEYLEAELGKVGIYLGLIELEEKNIALGEIKVSESYIKYVGKESDEEIKEIDQKIIDRIFKAPALFPIRLDTVLIENTKIFFNHDLLEAKRFKLYKKDKSFITRFHLANIRPTKESDFILDEIWGDAEITKKDINIYRIKIQHDVQAALIKGKVSNYSKLKNASAELNGEVNAYFANLMNEFMPTMDKVIFDDGSGRVGFKLKYSEQLLSGTADIYIKDLDSNILKASELRSLIKFENGKVSVDKLNLENHDENLRLVNPVTIYDFNKKEVPTLKLSVNLENFKLTNSLQALGPDFKILRGELNGEARIEIENSDIRILPKDGFYIKNLGLVTGEGSKSFTILMIKNAKLSKSEIAFINKEFSIDSEIDLKNSKLHVKGFVNDKKVSFVVPETKIDLSDFGGISQLGIKGVGPLSITVEGPPSETIIDIKGKTEGFEILGYHLDRADKKISINLGNSIVEIDKLESLVGKTRLSGIGTVNYKDEDIAIGITSNDANSGDLIQILDPIFNKLDFLPSDLDFKARVDADIFGKYKFNDLKIRTKVEFSDLTAASETISAGSFDLTLSNKVISVKNLEAIKGRGSFDGEFLFDLSNDSFDLKMFWENLELQSFQLIKKLGINLETLISGKIKGGGFTKDYKLNLEATAFDSRALNYLFDDSSIELLIQSKRLKGKANFLGSILTTDFSFGLDVNTDSRFDFKVSSQNIKPVLVAVLGKHLETENFSGIIDFDVQSKFDYGFKNLDLEASLNKFIFNHPEFNVDYKSSRPEFYVKDSRIQRWNLSVKQPDLYIDTKGEGTFGDRVSLIQEFHVNSKILELLSSKILSSQGFIRNIAKVNGNKDKFDFSLTSKTSDLDLSIEQVPLQLNDLKYNIDFAKKRLQIHEFSTSLDNGVFSILGDVFFDGEHPDVNLKFNLNKAEIPILGDSSINISGEGIILGNNYPYTVGGEIIINKGNIVEELNNFSSKSAAFSQVRFLPRNQESVAGKMFTINLNVKAENPVRISNSLMDIAFIGEMRLTGNPSRPRGEGRLTSPVNSSRIFFKNNEYQILSADINFSPKKEITNPDFDIQALTIISNYKIYPKAYGDLERFNFDLTSEPVLPRNSILSLIAFGYTDEIQTALYAKDQRSLTQVGVGSFVFDRFKISDILNKQFGLQVNLGTVIEQSSTDSLLSGRSQSRGSGQTAGALGRTRSATKIELKKRLDEALTLSVSSTMGGSIGQRQSMNLNYGLTKSIQLEGVYELRTNEEGEADIIYNSIGGDLKFRRTFK